MLEIFDSYGQNELTWQYVIIPPVSAGASHVHLIAVLLDVTWDEDEPFCNYFSGPGRHPGKNERVSGQRFFQKLR